MHIERVPMSRHLPPLTALRAFEAAGRHLSFTHAAAELSVTQAAISHQIKALESNLGIRLFSRLPRSLALTEAGQELHQAVSRSFDDIAAATAKLVGPGAAESLTVRSPPSFAAKWLSPRLKSFRRQYPAIDLHIRHSNESANFARDDIDLAVTYGNGDWPGVVAAPLLVLDFFPVCSPAYLKQDWPLDNPGNLRHYNLLHDATTQNWSEWLTLAGMQDVDPQRGTILDDTNVLIQAAIDGQGIALGSSVFVADHLESGRLIRPFDVVLEPGLAYHIVCPEDHLKRQAVSSFRDWALSQA